MEFEWDPKKAETNKRKHGVTFQEGTTVFWDPLAITYADPDHSDDEERHITFGLSTQKRCLLSHMRIVEVGQGLSVRVL
jgi:uncharacterized DUF497 family protein